MILSPLTEEVAIVASEWRNASPESCRTDSPSTEESQREWYARMLPDVTMTYWAVEIDGRTVGLAGLTGINSWSAEISLILDPAARGKGHGKQALALLVGKARALGVRVLYGEVYECSPARPFWHHALEQYSPKWRQLPERKLWQGAVYGSEYFSITL